MQTTHDWCLLIIVSVSSPSMNSQEKWKNENPLRCTACSTLRRDNKKQTNYKNSKTNLTVTNCSEPLPFLTLSRCWLLLLRLPFKKKRLVAPVDEQFKNGIAESMRGLFPHCFFIHLSRVIFSKLHFKRMDWQSQYFLFKNINTFT